MIAFHIYRLDTLEVVSSGSRDDNDLAAVVVPDGCGLFIPTTFDKWATTVNGLAGEAVS